MKNLGVYIHHQLRDMQKVFDLLRELREDYHYRFIGVMEQRELLPDFVESHNLEDPAFPVLDAILVFGGDGTILRAKALALATGAPILGINLGYLGFLSETTLSEIQASLQTLLKGKYKILKRMLLSCRIKRQGGFIYSNLALNDAVIYKADTPRLITVRIYNNRKFVFETRCDGVIASTPTGSTAYSLAAGGPIMSPEMSAMVLAPLNPHLLSIRPMVFPAQDELMMRVGNLEQSAWLQVDGINCHSLEEGDELYITASDRSVSFIKLSNRGFYRILRNKLHLGK